MRLLMLAVFRRLEPYAIDLWRNEIEHFLPSGMQPAAVTRQTFFGGLYQMVVITR
jgi:hypothetical protein